jgi:hypothetical protein
MGATGVGQRGRGDLNHFKGFKEVQFLAVCDVLAGAGRRAALRPARGEFAG